MKLTRTAPPKIVASKSVGELMPAMDHAAPGSRYPNFPQGIDLHGLEADIFRAMWAEDSPLTLRLLHQKTGIPVEHLTEAIAGLHSAGHISRLNTVIESYAPKAAADKRAFTPSLPPQHPLSTTGGDTKYDGYIHV